MSEEKPSWFTASILDKEFRSAYLVETMNDEKFWAAYRLEREYLVNTEEFDRRHCAYRNQLGVAIPTTGYERRLCSQYEQTERRRLAEIGCRQEIRAEDWAAAKRALDGKTHEQLVAEIEQEKERDDVSSR